MAKKVTTREIEIRLTIEELLEEVLGFPHGTTFHVYEPTTTRRVAIGTFGPELRFVYTTPAVEEEADLSTETSRARAVVLRLRPE